MLCLPQLVSAQTDGITPIISLPALKARLARHESDLLLLDVRPHAAYAQGHLPQAINLPAEISFNQKGDRTRIASLQQIRLALSRAGVRNSDYLVLYDDGLLKDAAHVFWVLETYGQEQISVLDGGYPGWVADHGRISQAAARRPASDYQPTIATHHLSTELATLLGTQNEHVAIIDARSRKEYLGQASHAARKGHIVSAINIPWSDNLEHLASAPRLKPRPALMSLYHMLQPDERVITYCNRGKESAVTYLVLRSLGYRVSIYDGAWLEWGNDVHLPIASGPAPAAEVGYVH